MLRTQQGDEAAAVGPLDLRVELDVDADLAAEVAELGGGGGAEVVGVHHQRAHCLQRRGPEAEDVAGVAGLPVALVGDDVVAGRSGIERTDGTSPVAAFGDHQVPLSVAVMRNGASGSTEPLPDHPLR
ncbi:hypothetical protein ACFY4I_39240 [Streptomyces scabiei]|uniref:hypothetical protein n=1 Tax=Streptomyces scabiei TaxID=1930 RepID=UPI00367AE192